MKITRQLIGYPHIPFMTFDSEQPGDRVFVVAGVHGDEWVGVEVAHCLANCVKLARGVLYMIPAANAQGLVLGMRNAAVDLGWEGVREGKDLNRVFPGSSRSNVSGASGIAWQIYDLVRSTNPTVVADLHNWIDASGIFSIIDRPLTPRARFAASQAEAFARKFGALVYRDLPLKQYVAVCHHKSLTGALVNHAHIPAFTVELGGALSKKNVFAGVTGVLNVLKHCNMLEEGVWVPRILEIKNKDVMRLEEVRESKAGMVLYDVKPGKLVFPGTRLARLTTHDGRVIEFKAKRVGLVLALGPKKYEGRDQALVTLAVAERRVSCARK